MSDPIFAACKTTKIGFKIYCLNDLLVLDDVINFVNFPFV